MRLLAAIRARWLSVSGGAVMFSTAVIVTAGPVIDGVKRWEHDRAINTPAYKARYGHWSLLDVPSAMRVDAVHAAMLYTGKVLIIAGSGNNRGNFDAGTFESILWDPKTDIFKKIPTPADMFCGGHAFLPDGKLLIAGGTGRYERLKGTFTSAAGVMTVLNGNATASVSVRRGTIFQAPDGRRYRAQTTATVPAATMATAAARRAGAPAATSGKAQVYVVAVAQGRRGVVHGATAFGMQGLSDRQALAVSATASDINLRNQDYWGIKKSFIFDPATERYQRVSDLTLARWYPSLVGLKGGKVLAVSGLDGFGRIIPGKVEEFDPSTRVWSAVPRLQRMFPTYPSLFLLPSGNLFFAGGNTGYGSATQGRTPGIWNLQTNGFQVVPGLRDPHDTETAGTMLLPPAQDQRYAIVGGGGVGESPQATSRIDVADLKDPNPHWQPAGRLPHPTRYPQLVITPDDKVVITGGSQSYRGIGDSDILECHLYDPKTGRLRRLADPTVGRDYHSEALLLPDGRIITLGSNPLNGIKGNHTPNYFEQRIEIYTPPYLYHGARPRLIGGPRAVARGGTATFRTPDAGRIATARLIRPSAVTHVTNAEQRSIALTVQREAGGVRLGVPADDGLVPSGWYMLFVADAHGTPSVAHWIRVG